MQVASRLIVLSEIGEDFSDDRREFESVPRACTGHQHMGMRWMTIYQKMFIGCVCVDTNRTHAQIAIGRRNKTPHRRSDVFHFARRYDASVPVDRRDFSTVMKRHFHAVAEIRETVEKAVPVDLP